MPDNEGRLSTDEQRNAIAWLKGKLKVKTCPLCGDENMTLDDSVSALPVFGKAGAVASITTPVIKVTCPTCGYIRLFSATMVGIVPRQS